MDSNKPQNIKKIKFAFLIASIVPILIWFISGLIATFLQSNMQGSLYAFPVPFFPSLDRVNQLFIVFAALCFANGIYCTRKKVTPHFYSSSININISCVILVNLLDKLWVCRGNWNRLSISID